MRATTDARIDAVSSGQKSASLWLGLHGRVDSVCGLHSTGPGFDPQLWHASASRGTRMLNTRLDSFGNNHALNMCVRHQMAIILIVSAVLHTTALAGNGRAWNIDVAMNAAKAGYMCIAHVCLPPGAERPQTRR